MNLYINDLKGIFYKIVRKKQEYRMKISGLESLVLTATMTVGGMAALSRPCERGIYTSMCCRCRRRAYRNIFMASHWVNNDNSLSTSNDKAFLLGG